MDAPTHKLIARRSAQVRRRRIVGVLGSGSDASGEHEAMAAQLGRWIAEEGYDVLTGAGAGLMEVVSRAFAETPGRRGLVVGIVLAAVPALEALERRDQDLAGPVEYELDARYPNQWVELAVYTHLPYSGPQGTWALSRNHINVLTADVLVALPGGEGTFAETWLALRYGVPVIAYHPAGEQHPLPAGAPLASELAAVEAFVRASMR